MILQYTDILGNGEPQRINVEITTDHPASHYGMPAVVLPDGQALNAESWVLMAYQVVKATPGEAVMMERWLKNLYAMLGIAENPAAALGRIKSDKKAASSRENGKKGGRPKDVRLHPRGDQARAQTVLIERILHDESQKCSRDDPKKRTSF